MTVRAFILSEGSRFGGETGAGLMRNRCAFTPRDMAADWPDAFTYAIVSGWGEAMEEVAAVSYTHLTLPTKRIV